MRPWPMRRHAPAVAALALTLFASAATQAQDGKAPPRWEVGAFALGVSQQAYPGSDTRLSRGLVLPYVIYRGDVLRADQGVAGLRAFKTERLELDVGFAGAFGARADEVPARQGMPRLGTLVEFGPRLKWQLHDPGQTVFGGRWRVEFPIRGVFDLRDSLARRGLAVEPELVFERRMASGLRTSTSVSAIFGDQRLADTFYGVAPAYATAGRSAYGARAGLIGWRVGTTLSTHLSPDWRIFGFARIDSVAGAANTDSPLVRQTTGLTAGVGVSWTWLRSSEAGSD